MRKDASDLFKKKGARCTQQCPDPCGRHTIKEAYLHAAYLRLHSWVGRGDLALDGCLTTLT